MTTDALGRPPAPVPDRLRQRLADRAEAAGLVEVAYRTLDSPLGPLLLAATPAGLVRVAFAPGGAGPVLAELAAAVGPRVLRAPARLDPAARQLGEYFAGARRHFDLDLDLRLARGFRLAVLAQLAAIPYGAVRTYAEVARAAGHPGAARAVGTACATNPLPLVVPCHRVVRADGTPGGYGGGTAAKAHLLALEAPSPTA